ncbi:peptide chain release factor N(5)-glutamine methyltransferase [Brooklawnia cerclae]|uniref:peptide chain release factor N(5)-glutamine methyltransferase n=1 Tax=Brooklawnia cerclae TaxID=349934 RepID=A0ABX0SIF8_9ACTN|nr:HemK/PrmC family methyltransferase [Brooklawnia cerclae]NIH56426.1 release factor glutamine methyltransferase [Brooklawnia cerclae]
MRADVLVRELADRLESAGIDQAAAVARELVAWVAGVTPGRLYAVTGLDAAAVSRAREGADRVAAHTPVQHVTGIAGFWGRDLAVGPGVFIPRPETEMLADWAGRRLRSRGVVTSPGTSGQSPLVVDLCSGSGALALAMHDVLPGARVLAVERSPQALVWLRRNVEGTPVEIVAGDMAEVPHEFDGRVDLVVANPPYVPSGTHLPPDVAGHDPDEALFAGTDGLDAVRVLVGVAGRLLRPGGVLAFEHDDSQGASAPAVAVADGRFVDVEDHDDLAGRPRFTTARRADDDRGSHGDRGLHGSGVGG